MKIPYLLIIPLAVLLLFSCKKQDDNVYLSNEGTEGFDGYGFTDTFSLFTSTVREDSLKTDSLSHNLLGVINDPVFGKYRANSFCQFKLPQLNKVISSENLDSVVLFLQFTSTTAYYGDLNSEIRFRVHELSESMNATVSHSNQTYSYDPVPAATFSGRLRISDSMEITELGKRTKVAPGISLRLSQAMADKLFNAASGDLSSQENFLQYFKGLALVADPDPLSGTGAIAALNLQGSFSKIRIYYNDTLQSDFRVIDNARRFSTYTNSGQSSEILRQKAAGLQASFDTTYLQAMGGAKTRIRIPYLFGIVPKVPGKMISVGKAELIIRPLAGSAASPFSVPTRLLLLQPNPENNLNAGIIDLLEPFYGGSFNSIKNEYRFNITRHIQSLFSDYQLRGKDNNRGLFLLTPSDFPIAPSRLLIDARKKLQNAGIEFRLIYTEL